MAAPTPDKIRFGKYWLYRRLAKGGMAELFLASPAAAGKDNERLVIKRLLPQYSEEEEFLHMFLDEARLASQLAHPSIVRIYDLGLEGGHLYIAMEFIDGHDLESLTRAKRRVLSPTMAAKVATEVCSALGYAHVATDLTGKALNIVHRDVTPENVMITRRGEVKLVDFGVAKATSKLGLTRPGVVKGKLSYMAPEHIQGKDLDGRADLFSLGATLYEVTTGIKPFERGQLHETVGAIIHDKPPPPDQAIKGFPPALSAIVMKALEKDRDRRYASAKEMKTDLERFLAQSGKPIVPSDIAALLDLPKAGPPEPRTTEPVLAAQAAGRAPGPDDEVPTNPKQPSPAQLRLPKSGTDEELPTNPKQPSPAPPPPLPRPAPQAPAPQRVSQSAARPSSPSSRTSQPVPAAGAAQARTSQSIPASGNRSSQPPGPVSRPGGSPPKSVPRAPPPPDADEPRTSPGLHSAKNVIARTGFEEALPEPETVVARDLAANIAASIAHKAAPPPPPPDLPPPPPPPPEIDLALEATPDAPASAYEISVEPVRTPPPPPPEALQPSSPPPPPPPSFPPSFPPEEPQAAQPPEPEPEPPQPSRPPGDADAVPTRSLSAKGSSKPAVPPPPAAARKSASPDDFAPPTTGKHLGGPGDDEKSTTVSHGQAEHRSSARHKRHKSSASSGVLGSLLFGALWALSLLGALAGGYYKGRSEMEARVRKLEALLAAPPVALAGPDAGSQEPSVAPAAADAGPGDAATGEAVDPAGPDAGAPDAGRAPVAKPDKPERPAIIGVTGKGTVLIDDRRCNAPCATQVAPGEHTVKLLNGRKPFERKVTVKAGQKELIRLP